jgi:hypothetical protein
MVGSELGCGRPGAQTFFQCDGLGHACWTSGSAAPEALIPPLRAGTALLASAGILSIVLVAQTTLANLFAGVWIALYEPFRIGDRLIFPAREGPEIATVESITPGNSILRTSEHRLVVVPSSVMATQTIINLSSSSQYRPGHLKSWWGRVADMVDWA